MTTLAIYNPKRGVGRTTLTWHLGYAIARMEKRVLLVDADPGAGLTTRILDDEAIERAWQAGETVFGMIQPGVDSFASGTDDVRSVRATEVDEFLSLLPGDMRLATLEPLLCRLWSESTSWTEADANPIAAASRGISRAAAETESDLVLIDIGPELGALTRTFLTSADYVVVALTPDIFATQGLRNLGPILNDWRSRLPARGEPTHTAGRDRPLRRMTPLGYILSQHDPYGTRPAPGYRRWTNRFPAEFRTNLLDPDGNDTNPPASPDDDPYFLGLIKNYRSLIMVAIEMHKPISELRPADGAFGALMSAVVECRRAYRALAEKVLERLI